MTGRVAASLLMAAAAGCAQPGTPPGGEVDRSPPRVLEVSPAMFDTIMDPGQRVVIRFNERLSERLQGVAEWSEAVLVSPATSPFRVRSRSRGVEVWLERGWQPGLVYRVVVRPVYQDLFGNQRVEPVELVFSTGAPISEAALAGFVTDRLTGEAMADTRVHAVRRIDDLVYVAATDTAGFFAMRFVPAGAYDIVAWQDQNRDGEPNFFELQDSADLVLGAADTAVATLAVLRPDTTPAVLGNAEPLDSTRVRLLFDDHFATGPVDGEAFVHSLPDSALVGRGQLIHRSRLDSILAAEAEARRREAEARRAEQDSLAALEPQADTAVEAQDTARAPQEPREAQAPGLPGPSRTQPAEPLPSRELILVMPGLQPGGDYYVRVVDVININGVPGGGGSAAFRMPVPPAETLPEDTAEVPRSGSGSGR